MADFGELHWVNVTKNAHRSSRAIKGFREKEFRIRMRLKQLDLRIAIFVWI